MFLRDAPVDTLSDVMERVALDPVETVTLSPGQVSIDMENSRITLDGTEHVMTYDGVKSMGALLDIPVPFLTRQEPDLQQVILDGIFRRQSDSSTYEIGRDGVRSVHSPSRLYIPAERIVDRAMQVMDPASQVRDFMVSTERLQLDVFVPENFDRGIGGDHEVDDLSSAGLRITHDRKNSLAPSVQPFQYRLFCTNGMSTRHEDLRVDARGKSVEEVLAEFESIAELAFTRAEQEMASFYDMRSQRVDDPRAAIARMAREAGLADRVSLALQDRIMDTEDRANDAYFTQFDLVNLMTNYSNNPEYAGRPNHRLRLEGGAGETVTTHAERCGHCHARRM